MKKAKASGDHFPMSESSTTPAEPTRPSGSKPSVGFLITIGIIATLLGFIFMGPCTWVVITPQVRDRGYIGQMGMALSSYATDNEGLLQKTLWELIPDYLSEEVFTKIRFCRTKKEDRFDWLYFPKGKSGICLQTPFSSLRQAHFPAVTDRSRD